MLYSIQNTVNRVLISIIGALLLASCGGSNQVPSNATIEISPNEKEWLIAPSADGTLRPCVADNPSYQDELIVVSVKDSEGRALGEVDLTVSLNLSNNTSSTTPVVALYEDLDGDLIPSDYERVSDAIDPLLRTKTAKYTGEKYLIVRMNLTCQYSATLMVVAETAVGTATLKVNESDEI